MCLWHLSLSPLKASLYDPQTNRTYAETAARYRTAILPAQLASRVTRPRSSVLIVERWLLGRLHHRTFYSLAAVNASIGKLPPLRS